MDFIKQMHLGFLSPEIEVIDRMEFTIKDSNKFWIPQPKKQNRLRFLHLATIQDKYNKEFVLFLDSFENKMYIERLVGSQLEFIEDDDLAISLNFFCEIYGLKTFSADKEYEEQPFVVPKESTKLIL